MSPTRLVLALAATATIASCGKAPPTDNRASAIEVRSPEQDRLHELNAFDLAIALKRAIYDLGYQCERVEKAGFVAKYKNLDMWTAHCNNGRDWAIFSGPDGSAQARDCKDLEGTDLPKCEISKLPEGSFDKMGSAAGKNAG